MKEFNGYLSDSWKTAICGNPEQSQNPQNDLNWHSLELRRKTARLTNKYQIFNGKIMLDIPEYIVGPTQVTCSFHRNCFINIGSDNNIYYKYNFFTRTLKEWNALPSLILNQSNVDAFKFGLTDYFCPSYWFCTLLYILQYLLESIFFPCVYFFLNFFTSTFTLMGNLCEL